MLLKKQFHTLAMPRESLKAFLAHAKADLLDALNGVRKINIVIGNESADLDSLSSSILYAYISASMTTGGSFASTYVPMLNIRRSELRLRPEFTTICRQIGITPSSLPNLSDIESSFACPEDTRWILVDHNKLMGTLGADNAIRVTGVIDHHDEEHAITWDTASEPRLIAKAGSCTSLVVEYFRPSWEKLNDCMQLLQTDDVQDGISDSVDAMYDWDAELAILALASILIDTANMTASQTIQEVDREAVKYLESKIMLSAKYSRDWDRRVFYARLEAAKSDVDSLTVPEILSKDFKAWTENERRLGICSIVKPLKSIVARCGQDTSPDSSEQMAATFMQDRALDLLVIMTAFRSEDGRMNKELLLQARHSAFNVATYFSTAARGRLGLTPLEINGLLDGWDQNEQMWCRSWLQGNIDESRKQVAPLIRAAMRNCPASQDRYL